MKTCLFYRLLTALLFAAGSLLLVIPVSAQVILGGSVDVTLGAPVGSPDFHAGIHSGSWTLKREQILAEESTDKQRSCRAPYCNRCSKHLADYGHEYQYIDGPSQRQRWYRGTAGSVAHVTQRCYDEHGFPYLLRGQPAAVMSWEYRRVLNHAIMEQIRARNAVAAEESAEDRLALLQQLYDAASAQAAESGEIWELFQSEGLCRSRLLKGSKNAVDSPCCPAGTQLENMDGEELSLLGSNGRCDYCLAKAKYLKDQAYLAQVGCELAVAGRNLQVKTAIADEAVRIALLSKDDADKATRFKRVMHKPPKYKEVFAAKIAAGVIPDPDAEEASPKDGDAVETEDAENTNKS